MSRTKPHEIVERALELSTADGCVVIADEESSANLRWAGNALTTNGVTRGRTLTVIATVDGKEGTASGVVSRSAVTAADLEPLVRAAEAAARGAGPAEDAQPLVTGTPASPDFTDGPAETSSAVFADFAPALGEAFARARAGGRELYGFANHELVSTYVGTSTGLRLRHDQPNGTLELNAKSPDRSRSAWWPRHPGLQGRGPDRAGRGAGRTAGLGAAQGGAARRAVRDAAAAHGGGGPADLPDVVGGGPGRGGGPDGLLQARRRHPRRGGALAAPADPAQRPERAGPGVGALRDRAQLGRRRLGVRQRPAGPADRVDQRRRAGPADDDPAQRGPDGAAALPVLREPDPGRGRRQVPGGDGHAAPSGACC